MTLGELKEKLRTIGKDTEDPFLETRVILSHLGFSPTFQIAEKDREVEKSVEEKAISLMEKRAGHWPMAYLTGEKEFWGLTFHVTPDVLIPRPDTETLVETVINLWKDNALKGDILDLCTGSGAIATALSVELDKDIHFSDLSPKALSVAEENYTRLTGRKAYKKEGDLLSPWKGKKFALIVSNPPYLTEKWCQEVSEEVKKEPKMALLGYGPEGLDIIERILDEAPENLEKGGYLALECDWRQCNGIRERLVKKGYLGVNIVKDLRGLDRVVYGRYDG